MPTLAQLSGSSANPTLITVQPNNPLIEPLDGPTTVDDVMDRFPEEVYQQGRDTHLYRFLQALGGDSGVGLIKKLAFGARLNFEAEFLNFQALDDFFSGQFTFNRLKSETYNLDTTGALTHNEWDEVMLADQSYKQRIAEFFTATRHGGSPEGVRLIAQSGIGIEAELVEHYKWIFDQFSDDPLGLTPLGSTVSTSEFVVVPRFLNLDSSIYNEGYSQTNAPKYTFGAASLPNVRPALGGTGPTVTQSYNTTPQTRLLPEIERNAIDLLDRLRPVGTFGTIIPDNTQFLNVPVSGDPFASSTRINVSRFVTGKAGVPWPPVDPQGNFFIEEGIEKESGFFFGSQRDLPVVFHTVENVHAYTNDALADLSYGTNAFYDASSGISPYETFRSEFVGNYTPILAAIFPFLLNLSPDNSYSASQAIAAQNTPLVMEGRTVPNDDITPSDLLVNGTYPLDYFSLPGVDQINYPDSFWWASRARFASTDATGTRYQSSTNGGLVTSEVIEIDLGRVREINFVNFDVITAPINITIEYDDISTPDREAVWLPVQRFNNLPFDNRVAFNADSRTSWFNAEFNFSDAKGNMVHTRYLRITFTRRDEPWPTSTSSAFPWSVFAKHIRVGRYVADYLDTVGPLLSQDTPLGLDAVTLASVDNYSTREVRQQFVLPTGSARGDQIPNVLGFGVLIQTNEAGAPLDQSAMSIKFQWSIWDVTTPTAPIQLRNGVEDGVVTTGLSWLDFYLPEELALTMDSTKIYELHINSISAAAANTVFTHSPATLATAALPGTLAFTSGSTTVNTTTDCRGLVSVGQFIVNSDIPDQPYEVNAITATTITLNVAYGGATATGATGYVVYPYSSYDATSASYVQDASRNLVMRVWADIADAGRDVLGNGYRYGTRRDLAKYVLDNTRAGWMSDPVPTPNAVEALYFDVRGTNTDGDKTFALIDAIRIAPRTPGVQMNVYYSQQNLNGDTPATEADWDYLLWIPVHASYTLRRSEIIQLPQQMRAAFLKLEFTNLNPQPFRVPTFPALPPKQYRLFPSWVTDQFDNSSVSLGQDPLLQTHTPVEVAALQNIASPTYEFQRNERLTLAQLALGTISTSQIVNAGLTDVSGAASVDTTTAQQIFLNTPGQFQNTQLIAVDQNTLLGQIVVQRFNPSVFTDPIEATLQMSTLVSGDVPFVSTMNDRLSEAYQGIIPKAMRFNKIARHAYDIEESEFNKKAYFVGIDTVQFLRNDYTVMHDDAIIEDNLYDDQMLEEDTWSLDEGTGIPDGTFLYVSYSVNPSAVDEQVFLSGFTPVELSIAGGPAQNVVVFDQPGKQGIQYFQGQDYDLEFGFDDQGNRTTSIVRSSLGERLGVPLQAIIYADAGTVVGHAVIPSPPTDDAGVVVGVAIASDTFEGPFQPNFGTGTFGGGTFADLSKQVTDSGTVIGVAVPSGVTTDQATDSGTVVGHAVISATEVFT